MAKIATVRTFVAFDAEGGVIYKGRGKLGAAQKAMDALYAYREAVKAASGTLYGNPHDLGRMEANGSRIDAKACHYHADMM